MRILVTGKNGQLGSEMQAISENYTEHKFIFTGSSELDITDAIAVDSFFQQNALDVVINCAAYTAVDKAEDEPNEAHKVNVIGVKNIVDACAKYNVKLIHISTDYVFDGTKNEPYSTIDAVSPIGVYGKTKLEGEQVVLNSNIASFIVRTSWVYSIFGNNFVKTMLRLGAERTEVSVVDDQYGSPTYAKDLAKACVEMSLQTPNWPEKPTVYHYSNEGIISWFEFAQEIMLLANLSCSVLPIKTEQYPTKAARPKYSALDTAETERKFHSDTNNWSDSLKEMIASIKQPKC